MRKLIPFLIFSFLFFFLQAQEPKKESKEENFNVKREIKNAKRSLRQGDIYAAADIYQKVIDFAPERTDIIYELAEAYRYSRDYENSAIWYLKADSLDKVNYPLSTYYAGLMLKMNNRCDEAILYFEHFYKKNRGDFSQRYKVWAKREIEGCHLSKQLKEDALNIKITHLDSNVNSYYTDISPLLWNDSTLIYASLPTDSVIVIENRNIDHGYYIKFYSVDKKDSIYSNPQPFKTFTDDKAHLANGAFSPDKKRFYFTKCYENINGVPICSIFESKFQRGEWTEARALPDYINPGSNNSTHPTIALHSSGSEILYFVSDREGGRGQKDIWYSLRKRNGEFSEPRNAGTRINTDRDELTPFYDNQTQTLYFSSDGHVGIGGFDVFYTTGEKSRWVEPTNIGYPVNSSTDDMYYRTNEYEEDKGYLVSNRPGIISIRNETCCDDIFEFKYFNKKAIYVKGFVYEEGDPKQEKINLAKVELLEEDSLGNSTAYKALNADTTRENMPYFFQIDFQKKYKVVGSKKTYLSGSSFFNTIGNEKSDTLNVDIYLKRFEKNKAYQLKNIYYDYDKWFLREASKRTLDTLYNIMIDNPLIIVEIGSHTDIRGSDSYNKILSQKRAESCVQYLIDKGIGMNRLLARGYGESKLIRKGCEDIPGCPEEGEGDCPCHQANRRTEFQIVGELDAVLDYKDERYKESK